MPSGYPILLDVSDKRIVIVGGGAVALRKVNKLIEAGATQITVVSPRLADGFPDSIHRIAEEYKPAHLIGAAIVFAATDVPEVNAAVVAEARRQGIWVSRADEGKGDFAAAAALRVGGATVGFWADSPALAAAIRDKMAQRWDPRWTAMADAMRTLRPMVLSSGLNSQKRREVLRELASETAMEKLATGGIDALKQWIEPKLRDGK
ncbi:MAG TPA: bifunctional precorrin-2 dehydrogenase/sirohydrochlorin ferrochelatase [Tepidisphaeraceae bacterium]|nr:bifunctional precorrin-2 dehydrogenase/sirohydrochlorin ferrochelatase [Tepidisphaeraceae bacterium]